MTKYIIANWKSNLDINKAIYWLEQLEEYFFDVSAKNFFRNHEIIIAPPYPLIPVLAELSRSLKVKLSVQDLSPYGAGSYTGAVCAQNLTGLNVNYALLGHSERRRLFQETPSIVADKLIQAWQADMTAILCLDQEEIEPQLQAIQSQVENWQEKKEQLIVAYEPAAAIGSGESADVEQVQTVIEKIRQIYHQPAVLYGGSVTAQNTADFLQISDGVLVGSASLKTADFIRLLEAIKEASQ